MLEPHCSSVFSSGQWTRNLYPVLGFLGLPMVTALQHLLTRAVTKDSLGPGKRLCARSIAQVHLQMGRCSSNICQTSHGFPVYRNKRNEGSSAWQKAIQLQEELPTQGNKKYFKILFPSLTGVYVGVGGI